MIGDVTRLQRQRRFLEKNEARRRMRKWIQAFQLGMIVFFVDQILKSYCSGQLDQGGVVFFLNQTLLGLANFPVQASSPLVSRWLGEGFAWPQTLSLVAAACVFAWMVWRRRQITFFETASAWIVMGSLVSMYVSRLLHQQVHTFALVWGKGYVSFSLADVSLVVAGFFLLRAALASVFQRRRLPRHSYSW